MNLNSFFFEAVQRHHLQNLLDLVCFRLVYAKYRSLIPHSYTFNVFNVYQPQPVSS